MKLSTIAVKHRPVNLLQIRQLSDNVFRKILDKTTTQPGDNSAETVKRKRQHSPRKRIFSGIQPTGVPHLGNYLGALRRWKQFQDEKKKSSRNLQLLFAIADLHALTTKQDPAFLRQQRLHSYASLLAIGLDPKECILFMQSEVPYHTRLMWVLSTIASTGYLSRMTQWKSKLGFTDTASLSDADATEKLKLGLFSYPVLQAADILLYRPDVVPVGEDQAQHVEFTRVLARGFNSAFCNKNERYFKPPEVLLSPAKRVMSLKEPDKKMSKSHQDPMSRILITDSQQEIQDKIKKALTDSTQGISYDPVNRPGVSNLIEIVRHTGQPNKTCEEIASDNANISMRAFKEFVADNIVNELKGIREQFHELIDPKNHTLNSALTAGNRTAHAIAGDTMLGVDKLLGLDDVFRPNLSEGVVPVSKITKVGSTSKNNSTSKSLKNEIIQEQIDIEKTNADEPDVLPQKDEGVDRPIAS